MTHGATAPLAGSAAAMVQPDFFTALFNPLVSLDLAGELIAGARVDRVMAMLEEGRLKAVNVARDLDSAKRLLRVWRWSIDAHCYPHIASQLRRSGPPDVASQLPHRRDYLWSSEVSRFLACSDQHVANLVADQTVEHRRDGLQRLVRIERQSLIAFLEARAFDPAL